MFLHASSSSITDSKADNITFVLMSLWYDYICQVQLISACTNHSMILYAIIQILLRTRACQNKQGITLLYTLKFFGRAPW